jgi:parallel beta-helix repeat protein
MTKFNIGFIILSFIIAFACKKKDESPSVIGLDVQPESDLVGITVTDSVSVFMHTEQVNGIRTYNDQYKFLGSNQDPIFGRTDASIYTNFSIPNNLSNVTFGANPVLDSAEIVIRFTGESLGNASTNLQYQVHVLNQKLDAETSYSSTTTVPMSASTVSSYIGNVKPRGGFPCLVVPLDNNLAEYILKTNSNLVNNTAFLNAYKGLYITSSNSTLGVPGSGAIRRCDLDDDLSGINLYYHDGNSADSKGQKFQFVFKGIDALRYNYIKHNYTSGATQNLFDQLSGNEAAGNANLYLNAFGGTRVKVELPYIQNFKDSQNVSISRAELIIKVDELKSPYSFNYKYPSTLALIANSSDGTEQLVYDQLEVSDFGKYGGNYDSTKRQYVFNIARQMQKIINGEITNYGFYLVNARPNVAFVARRDDRLQRVVVGGKNNLSYKPVFKVTYVKYPFDK